MGTYCLGSSSAEKDLKVPVSNRLNMSQQCALTGMKANSRLRWFCKCVTSRLTEEILPLFSAVVRLHLGYCVQFGVPSARKIRICYTKYSKASLRWLENWHMMCDKKLRELGSFSLRRLEGQEAAVMSCRKGNPT